jgi:hypothetical protein
VLEGVGDDLIRKKADRHGVLQAHLDGLDMGLKRDLLEICPKVVDEGVTGMSTWVC